MCLYVGWGLCLTLFLDKYKCFGVATGTQKKFCVGCNENLWILATISTFHSGATTFSFFHLDISKYVVWMKLQIEWIYILCSIGIYIELVFFSPTKSVQHKFPFIFQRLYLITTNTNGITFRDWYCLRLSICVHAYYITICRCVCVCVCVCTDFRCDWSDLSD